MVWTGEEAKSIGEKGKRTLGEGGSKDEEVDVVWRRI